MVIDSSGDLTCEIFDRDNRHASHVHVVTNALSLSSGQNDAIIIVL